MNQEQYKTFHPSLQQKESYRLTEFYGNDIIILILSNSEIQKIDNFHINNYLISLYSYSYYYCQPNEDLKKIKIRANVESPSGKKLIIQKISQYLEGEEYLHRLFTRLLKTEENALVRFYLLYQVIELIIQIIFDHSVLDLIEDFKINSNKDTYELKESILSISSEKQRISKLISTLQGTLEKDSKINLLEYCNDLLIASNGEKNPDLASALYAVRNLIVHKFRKLPERDLPKIEEINKEFENIVIKIILNYDRTTLSK